MYTWFFVQWFIHFDGLLQSTRILLSHCLYSKIYEYAIYVNKACQVRPERRLQKALLNRVAKQRKGLKYLAMLKHILETECNI